MSPASGTLSALGNTVRLANILVFAISPKDDPKLLCRLIIIFFLFNAPRSYCHCHMVLYLRWKTGTPPPLLRKHRIVQALDPV